MTKVQQIRNKRLERAATLLSNQVSPYLTSVPRTVVLPKHLVNRILVCLRRLGKHAELRAFRAALQIYSIQHNTYRVNFDALSLGSWYLRWRQPKRRRK